MNILEVRNLSVRFPTKSGTKTVLKDVSFTVESGKITGIVGESGSGKTMTALTIAKLLPPKAIVSSGEVLFSAKGADSVDLLSIGEREMRKRFRGNGISMIFQNSIGTFNPVVSIGSQIEEMFHLHTDLRGGDARKASKDLLKQVHLPDIDEKYGNIVGSLSGGQAQRASIAMMGLVTNPYLLIADEITTALDVTVQAQVLDFLAEIVKENGITLILITHDFGLIAEHADRVVVLDQGSVVEQGTTEEIFSNPKSDYVRGVLRNLPRMGTYSKAPKKNEPVLTMKDVHVGFPVFGPYLFFLQREIGIVKAMDGVSLTLNKGEILGVVGESGCGKTTLMRSVLGVLPPEAVFEGSITLGTEELTTLPEDERRRMCKRVGGVAQNPTQSLNSKMRIRDIIAEGLDIHNLYRATSSRGRDEEKTERVEALMKSVGLPTDRMYDFTGRFSGGELQRVAIARALATDPEVLILDEPTSSLDASRKRTIMELLMRLRDERKLSLLLITHELPTVAEMCDRVAVMYLGRIVEEGTVEEVFTNPRHPYTMALLDAVPIPDPKQARARSRKLLEGEVPSATNIPSGCRFRTRCPYVQDRCFLEDPVLTVQNDGHFAACYYAEEIAAKNS